MDSASCEICGQQFAPNIPHVCAPIGTVPPHRLQQYSGTTQQAELVERMATHWHSGPTRHPHLIEDTSKRIQAVLTAAGLRLAAR